MSFAAWCILLSIIWYFICEVGLEIISNRYKQDALENTFYPIFKFGQPIVCAILSLLMLGFLFLEG